MIEALLPFALALIMFSLGLGLERKHFLRVLARPRTLIAGVLAQVVLLPVTAFLIASGLSLEPSQAVGLMILAACPGGATAGLLTRLAGGETALSISLSVITGALAFLTVPLIVGMSLAHFLGNDAAVTVPVGMLIGSLIMITLLPVSLGIWLRESGRCSAQVERLLHKAATAIFLMMVIYTFASNWGTITGALLTLGPACLLLNLIGMGNGVTLGAAARLDVPARVALAMECGVQNAALGITLSLSILRMPELAAASVLYALLMNFSALGVIAWRKHRTAHKA